MAYLPCCRDAATKSAWVAADAELNKPSDLPLGDTASKKLGLASLMLPK